MYIADIVRKRLNPGKSVGWIIDRNVNITNYRFCIAGFATSARLPGAVMRMSPPMKSMTAR
jgi:hypothetical protein